MLESQESHDASDNHEYKPPNDNKMDNMGEYGCVSVVPELTIFSGFPKSYVVHANHMFSTRCEMCVRCMIQCCKTYVQHINHVLSI